MSARKCVEIADEYASQERDWIDVNERLPEQGDEDNDNMFSLRVLIIDFAGYIQIARYDYEFNCWVTKYKTQVTHWMPLPKIPKL